MKAGRSADYAETLKRARTKPRRCKRCGQPRLAKKELVAFLDELSTKSHKTRKKSIAFVAAQVAGYCGVDCRAES